MIESAPDFGGIAAAALRRLAALVMRKNTHWRSVITLMTGTAGAQAIGIASMLALTRVFSPAEFGAYAFFFTVSGLITLLSTGRYELAAYLAEDESEALDIAALAIAPSCLFGALLLAFSPVIERIVVSSAAAATLHGTIAILALTIVSGGALAATTAVAIQQRGYKAVSSGRLAQAIVTAITSLVLGIQGWSSKALMVGFLLGQIAALLVHMPRLRQSLRQMSLKRLLSRARQHSAFPRFTLASELFNNLGSNLVGLLMPAFFGTSALGQYNLGQRVAGLPITLMGGAIGEVFRSSISPQHMPSKGVGQFFVSTSLRLAAIALMLVLPIALAGPYLFSLIFGARWINAGLYTQILSPVIFSRMVVSPLSATLMRAKWQWLDAVFQFFFVIASLGAFELGRLQNDLQTMLEWLSAFQVSIYALYFFTSYAAAKKIAKIEVASIAD